MHKERALPGDETAAELDLPPPPLADWLRPFGGIKVDRRRLAIHDQSRMGPIVLCRSGRFPPASLRVTA